MLPAGSRVSHTNRHAAVVVVFTFVYSSDAAMAELTRGVLLLSELLQVTNQAGLLASMRADSPLQAAGWREVGGRSPVLATTGEEVEVGWLQWEDASLIAMITGCEVPGCCRGFGVSLCILGTMDEVIQPLKTKRGRAVALPACLGRGRHPAVKM